MQRKTYRRALFACLLVTIPFAAAADVRTFEASFPPSAAGNPNFPAKANAKITVTNIRAGAGGSGPGSYPTTGSVTCMPGCGNYAGLNLNAVVYTSGAGVVTLGAAGSAGATVTFKVED